MPLRLHICCPHPTPSSSVTLEEFGDLLSQSAYILPTLSVYSWPRFFVLCFSSSKLWALGYLHWFLCSMDSMVTLQLFIPSEGVSSASYLSGSWKLSYMSMRKGRLQVYFYFSAFKDKSFLRFEYEVFSTGSFLMFYFYYLIILLYIAFQP